MGPLNYQWQQSDDGINWVDVSGATNSTFVLGNAQGNQFIRVREAMLTVAAQLKPLQVALPPPESMTRRMEMSLSPAPSRKIRS